MHINILWEKNERFKSTRTFGMQLGWEHKEFATTAAEQKMGNMQATSSATAISRKTSIPNTSFENCA